MKGNPGHKGWDFNVWIAYLEVIITLIYEWQVNTLRLMQAIKLLYALVLVINKATCLQDKRISQIKDWYAVITDIWNNHVLYLMENISYS